MNLYKDWMGIQNMNTASCRQVNLIMVYLLPSKKYFGMKKLQMEAQIIKIPILPIKWTYLKHYL